jgi:hypothetical protein
MSNVKLFENRKISGLELSTLCRQFTLQSPDGKLRETDDTL